ncbi:MAG: hypothetical protein ACREMK_09900 [Gemmatimonadota bacterium]
MIATTRVRLDRIASSTRNARLTTDVVLGPEIVAREGYVLAVRILDDKVTYNVIEDPGGRLIPLRAGDLLAGTLGSRRALKGYAGHVPDELAVGDVVEVLNLGGVLGRCTSVNPELGPPFHAEVLGAVLAFPALGDRIGRPAHIREHAIPPAERLTGAVPVVYVSGTSMDAGKTVAASEIVRGLSRSGRRVAACKLTGVALMQDALAMQDAGAIAALTFNDAGRATTRGDEAVPIARGILNRLAGAGPDIIVAELGDGILGDYGVQEVLADPGLMTLGTAHVLCAADPVGCWGAAEIFRREYGLSIAVVSGPVTDNQVGRAFVRDTLGLPAHNARHDAAGLLAAIQRATAGGTEQPIAVPVEAS